MSLPDEMVRAQERAFRLTAKDSDLKHLIGPDHLRYLLEVENPLKAKETAKDAKLRKAVKEFIDLMGRVEESDSGKEFRPNQISSCRALEGERLQALMDEMGKLVND